jgi:hypothetical protein
VQLDRDARLLQLIGRGAVSLPVALDSPNVFRRKAEVGKLRQIVERLRAAADTRGVDRLPLRVDNRHRLADVFLCERELPDAVICEKIEPVDRHQRAALPFPSQRFDGVAQHRLPDLPFDGLPVGVILLAHRSTYFARPEPAGFDTRPRLGVRAQDAAIRNESAFEARIRRALMARFTARRTAEILYCARRSHRLSHRPTHRRLSGRAGPRPHIRKCQISCGALPKAEKGHRKHLFENNIARQLSCILETGQCPRQISLDHRRTHGHC